MQMYLMAAHTPEHTVGAPCQVGVLNQCNILCSTECNANVCAKGLQGLRTYTQGNAL
jgi:hypothetical protein